MKYRKRREASSTRGLVRHVRQDSSPWRRVFRPPLNAKRNRTAYPASKRRELRGHALLSELAKRMIVCSEARETATPCCTMITTLPGGDNAQDIIPGGPSSRPHRASPSRATVRTRAIVSPSQRSQSSQSPGSGRRQRKFQVAQPARGGAVLAAPTAVAEGPDRAVYVLDMDYKKVAVFNRDGSLRLTFGGYGTGEASSYYQPLLTRLTVRCSCTTSNRHGYRYSIFADNTNAR